MPDLTCNCCGGKDFYDEAGFYFCSECQTQSQDVQVQEFDRHHDTIVVSKPKKIKSLSSSSKVTDVSQITSWECYNYILLGLTAELIELGASETIKFTVQTLWFNYLKKIQVLHKNAKRPPALPAYNNKYDAQIIYGRTTTKKKKNRKRTSSTSSNGSVSGSESVSRREQNRLKRKMAEAAYDSGAQSDGDALLNDISLSSLKSSKPASKRYKVSYNKEAKVELLSHMSKKHMKEHIADVEGDFECHNMTALQLTNKYIAGPTVMSQSKLYCILYLALLINKQDIQLADLLRYMEDGSLSYNHYQHFFPEDIDNQNFLKIFTATKVNRHANYLHMSSKLVNYLSLEDKLPLHNIPSLVLRYCKELNLPKSISELCISFIAEMQLDLKITRGKIPNYEAKAMCVIIFVLKLFFGLDGRTEYEFSKLAREVNTYRSENMFVFEDWLGFLIYRRLVLSKHHFPTQFAYKDFSTVEYLDFVNFYNEKNDVHPLADLEYEKIARLLSASDADDATQSGAKFFKHFVSSLTPMHDNLQVLNDAGVLHMHGYNLDCLLLRFHDCSLNFILNSQEYLHPRVEHHSGGANHDINMVAMPRRVKLFKKLRGTVAVDILDSDDDCSSKELECRETSNVTNCSIVDGSNSQFEYKVDEQSAEAAVPFHRYPVHYHPECNFWLWLGTDLEGMRMEEYDEFSRVLPQSFRHLLTEFASVIRQTPKELLMEYKLFETYSCYHYVTNSKKKLLNDIHLRRILTYAKQNW